MDVFAGCVNAIELSLTNRWNLESDIAITEYNEDVALTVVDILPNSYAEQHPGIYLTPEPCYVPTRTWDCNLRGLTVYQVPTPTLLAG